MSTELATRGDSSTYDVERIRRDFPILRETIYDRPLVYLDNAATSHRPMPVLETLRQFHMQANSNVHRGVHLLSQRATEAFEGARDKVRAFINARKNREIVFVRGTTEGINLVAHSFVEPRLQAGDEVLVTEMEHHSNIVPWQLVCERSGARVVAAPVTDRGEVDLEAFEGLIGPRTRFAAIIHVSNALGTINPLGEMIAAARRQGVPVLVDGAQAMAHMPVDVQGLGCDFYAFSGHKLYGPTGIGALYGRLDLLQAMRPYQGGGDMIRQVSFAGTSFADPPQRFEAGTPNIAGAVGLGAAIDYVRAIGLEAIAVHERDLLEYGTRLLEGFPGLRLIGTAPQKTGVFSFVFDGVHAHDVGSVLDRQGIAIRAGHHCAQPLMQRFGVDATARASLGIYNTRAELDALVTGLEKVREIFC